MKTNKLQLSSGIIRFFSFVILVLAFIACEGPMGPEGPQGPQGYDGLDGLDGISTTYSAIYDVDPSEWDGDIDGYVAFLNVPEITEDIYDAGAVLVYRLFETEPKSFNMLPYTYVDNALTVYMDFDAYVGSIDLIYKEVFDGANDTFAPEDLMSFKVVIIEGIPLAALKTMVDVKDFNAVTKLLKLDNVSNKVKIY